MGNESSGLKASGLQVSEQAVDVTSDWALHQGQLSEEDGGADVAVFVAQPRRGASSLLDKAIRNCKIYRHPSILRYVSSSANGCKGGAYLVTEAVVPLSTAIKEQSSLQICLGLYSVLRGVIFLHEKACCSHNNVCRAAIYVSPNGSWKLGGLEFVCRFSEGTSAYLESTKARRYDRCVAPEEGNSVQSLAKDGSRDAYAFGVLLEEVLRNQDEEELPGTQDLLLLAKGELQNMVPSQRPPLSTLLSHHYFSLDLIAIHNFLRELPIKGDAEKAQFFSGLVSKLASLPEEMVASQLGDLLLGRMVLLDTTACANLLPHLLTPKGGESDPQIIPLFSCDTFKQHLLPSLTKIFQVRDVQIRLSLLKHFPAYCTMFTREQLQTELLPQVLLGIKDVNNELVSASLRALAELVPLLGATKVVGGQRGKLFNDGKPKKAGAGLSPDKRQLERLKKREERKQQLEEKRKQREKLKALETSDVCKDSEEKESEAPSPNRALLLERHPPDGGESGESINGNDDGTDSWSEWEDAPVMTNSISVDSANLPTDVSTALAGVVLTKSIPHIPKPIPKPPPVLDIMDLDIKVVKKPEQQEEEEDFFADMEPVISSVQKVLLPTKAEEDKFEVKLDEPSLEQGWGEELEWGADED